MIDPVYLPFTREELRPHFTMDADRNIDDFERSARACREFLREHPVTTGIPISISKVPRQIEKDERFWTATSLKTIFDLPDRVAVLTKLLPAIGWTHHLRLVSLVKVTGSDDPIGGRPGNFGGALLRKAR